MSDVTPHVTEAVHPSEFIGEELAARGWSRWHLARLMSGDRCQNRLILDMYFEVGPTERNLRMGDIADDLGRAFGVSGQYFRNLEISWLAATNALPARGRE